MTDGKKNKDKYERKDPGDEKGKRRKEKQKTDGMCN